MFKTFLKGLALCGLLMTGMTTAVFADKEISMTQMQKFYYDMGRKSSRGEHVKEGYALALADFRGMLGKYRKKVAAWEASKYLMEDGKMTYPETYKIRENGSYKIKVMAPKIEREFSPEDLFLIPLLEGRGASGIGGDSPYGSSSYGDELTSARARGHSRNPNAFSLPATSGVGKHKRPSSPGAIKSRTTLYIPYKSPSVQNFLEIYNAKYAETKNGYQVRFANKKEKTKFCQELSGDPRCNNLLK